MQIEKPATQQLEAQVSTQSAQVDIFLREICQQYQQREYLFKKIRELIYSSSIELILQTVVNEVQQLLQAQRVLICSIGKDNSNIVAFESVLPPYASTLGKVIDIDQELSAKANASFVIPIILKVEVLQDESTVQNCWGHLVVHNYGGKSISPEWIIETLEQLSIELAIAIKQSLLTKQVQKEISYRHYAEALLAENSQQLEVTLQELNQVQKQLLQNEKMANLGQLVTNMANEINNPVNFIHGTLYPASQYAEDLIRLIEAYQYYYPKPPGEIVSQIQRLDLDFVKTDFLKLLWSMRAGSDRVKEIVFALQNFSRFDDGQVVKADLHEGIDSVLRILQHRLKEQPDRPRIELIKEFGKLPLVECYPGELNQVFMNIFANAIDALEERMRQDYSFIPRIWITTEVVSSHLSLVSIDEPKIIDQKLSKKQKVVIRIFDNGKGMLPHIQRRIFEPFFTTKPLGQAKGLGLSISQQIIVEKHQGKLKCNSQPGEGTEFVIEMNTIATPYAHIRQHANF